MKFWANEWSSCSRFTGRACPTLYKELMVKCLRDRRPQRPRPDSNPQPSVYEQFDCLFMGDPGTPVNCYLIHPNALVCTHMNVYSYACAHVHVKYTTSFACEGAFPSGWWVLVTVEAFTVHTLSQMFQLTHVQAQGGHMSQTSQAGLAESREKGMRWGDKRERVVRKWERGLLTFTSFLQLSPSPLPPPLRSIENLF